MNLVIINRCFLIKIILPIIFLYLWEPKMCRLTLQLLGMLGNVLGMLCNVLGMLATSSAVLGMLQQGLRSPTSKRNPPHLLPYKLWSLVVHYSLGFTAYKAASGGVSLRCETPRTLLKHAEDGRGRCKHA